MLFEEGKAESLFWERWVGWGEREGRIFFLGEMGWLGRERRQNHFFGERWVGWGEREGRIILRQNHCFGERVQDDFLEKNGERMAESFLAESL